MQRRNKTRNIAFVPGCTRFAALGREEEAGDVTIGLDMIEAMRLVDAENLSQQEAAARMGVSTPTLCRILGEARRRTVTALLGGQNIVLEGGNIMLTEDQGSDTRFEGYGRNAQHGARGQHGYGRGRGQGMGAGCATGEEAGETGSCSESHGHKGHCHGQVDAANAPIVHYHYHYHYTCAGKGDELAQAQHQGEIDPKGTENAQEG